MFSPPRLITPLPANAKVHVRLRWQRGLLGLPVLTPRVIVQAGVPRR